MGFLGWEDKKNVKNSRLSVFKGIARKRPVCVRSAKTGEMSMMTKRKASLLRKLVLLGSVALMPLSFAQTASAQDNQAVSFGDMLAPGGLQLPLGITAEATIATTGTGVPVAEHGETGNINPQLGGVFNGFGFDPTRPVSDTDLATRLRVTDLSSIDRGIDLDFKDAIGFHVKFTSGGVPAPIPVDYFYGLDIDSGSEWKAAFGFNGDTFVAPTITLHSNTDLEINTPTVNSAVWESDLGLSASQNIPTTVSMVATASGGNADPDDFDHQAIYDFGGQPLTELIFLFGLEPTRNNTNGSQNSGISSLFLRVPEFDVGKGASAATVQPDGSVNVTYVLDVKNSGGVDFTGVTISDVLSFSGTVVSPPSIVTAAGDADSFGLTPNSAWTGVAPNTELLTAAPNSLAAGDSFKIGYTLNVDGSAGQISNIAQTSGSPVGYTGQFSDDGSDPDTDSDGNPDTTPNVPGGPGIATARTLPLPSPSLSMTKTADSQGPHSPGDVVTYTYAVTNDGDVNIDDVTVTDVHNGFGPLGVIGLGALTNTSGTSTDDGSDGVFDVLAPGDIIDFTAEYVVTATDLLLGNTVTNTATATGTPVSGTLTPVTANESISLAGTPRPALKPDACGAFSREGFIINPGSPSSESSADFGSGAPGPGPFDPYVLEPHISRNSSTGVVNFYQTSADASATGSFLSNGIALRNADNVASTIASDLDHISEIWRVAARVDGVPGTTETLTIQNSVAHEHTAYWQTDVNGTIINSNSSSNAGEDDGWIYGTSTAVGSDGISFTIDVTYPADGIVILQFAQLDSTGGFGGVDFDEYECPEPSLSMTKVADSKGPHLAGDVVTYTYTVTNDGNTNIEDVVITDTHNGSDPAPTPKSETLLTDAAPAGDSTDAIANDGSWDVLAPGDTLTFEGKYTVTQTDVDNL